MTAVPAAADPLRTSLVWEATRAALLEYFHVCHCVKYRCVHNIPPRGPIILAPNHVSYYDPPLIAAGVPHRIRFMAWDALFRIPGFASLIRAYGAFPVRTKSADKGAVEATLDVLRAGGCLMIFPEGMRSKTGRLEPLEKGLARLALSVGAWIVPVSVIGAFEAYNIHHLLPRPFRPIVVKYHPAFWVEPMEHPREVKARTVEINAQIERHLRRRIAAHERLKAMRSRRRIPAP
ncbi:MAG: 1-acyl-sn-glycerol-3-phosphate acyltransferase [Candidatus Sumerlaeaceae bacterium]|nr:1-acyl-sn-glycerol-3-phosphate acyltransferase [Candidatus Sumerlaeaceae bacterium]